MKKYILVLIIGLIIGTSITEAQNKSSVDHHKKELKQREYGRNIIQLSPIDILDIGTGPSISYERILGKDKKVSIIFPFSVLLDYEQRYFGYNNNADISYLTYFYFTPGIKLYPVGQKAFTYAIGASIMLGYGGGNGWTSGSFEYYIPVKKEIFRMGLLINNYINFQITHSFSFGFKASLGMRYLDHKKIIGKETNIYNEPIKLTGQFSFNLGYRF